MAHEGKPTEKRMDFQGLPLLIEWPKGSVRTGVNHKGEAWERIMAADYGYVDAEGAETSGDGENLDVYVGPDPNAPDVFVIEQLTEDGQLDEYKCMLGWTSEDEAVEAYRKHYPPDWNNVGDVFAVSVKRLKELVQESAKQKAKKAAFLMLEDVRQIGRKVLESSECRNQIESIAPGKTLKVLNAVELDTLGALPLPKLARNRFSSRLLTSRSDFASS